MYAEDGILIADYAGRSAENFFRVGLFVQGTIQQHLERVPRFMAAFADEGLLSPYLSARQRRALTTLSLEAGALHDMLFTAYVYGEVELMKRFLELPGFGFAKAGFLVQLVTRWGDIGCMDSHNLRLAGLDPRVFRKSTNVESLSRRVAAYRDACIQFGRSATMWDRWCAHVARLRPHVFPTPEHVSKLHVQCILGG